MPESYVGPLKEALEERSAKKAKVYDPAKRLEQFTAQRNRTLKLKEELQAEVDEQRASLAVAEGRLAKAQQDLEFFQGRGDPDCITRATATVNGASVSTRELQVFRCWDSCR